MSYIRYIEHVTMKVDGADVLYFELEVPERTGVWQDRGDQGRAMFPPALLSEHFVDEEAPRYRADIVQHFAKSSIDFHRIYYPSHPEKCFVFQLHTPSGSKWGANCFDLDPLTSIRLIALPLSNTPHLKEAIEQAWDYAIPLKDLLPEEVPCP